MDSFVRDDATRAATFFALAFGLTALGGLAIGDLRVGIQYGLPLGVAFAVFAYVFLVPTVLDDEGDGDDGPIERGPRDDASGDADQERGNDL
jgi:hypothetical protein